MWVCIIFKYLEKKSLLVWLFKQSCIFVTLIMAGIVFLCGTYLKNILQFWCRLFFCWLFEGYFIFSYKLLKRKYPYGFKKNVFICFRLFKEYFILIVMVILSSILSLLRLLVNIFSLWCRLCKEYLTLMVQII